MTQKPKDDTTQKPKVVLCGVGVCANGKGMTAVIKQLLEEKGYDVDLEENYIERPSFGDLELCLPKRIDLAKISVESEPTKIKPPPFRSRDYKKR